MAEVIANVEVAPNIFRLKAAGAFSGRMGQFYMVRAWDRYPLLSRPLSIFDLNESGIEFLYQVTGEGTRLLSALRPGDELQLEGPFGNGFPEVQAGARIALVGGGIGIAPLHYALRNYRGSDVYLGFSQNPYLTENFEAATTGKVLVNVGGIVLEQVDFHAYDTIISCGPEPMLKAVQRKKLETKSEADVYVSLENRMACGIGACLVCSVKCLDKRRKACADGPVFLAEEVVFE
ncbi:dihydroorotate dehydrogenase electron transfer subunit [Paenibacillus lentus]|uniref:Dihydroorotate dehydrogenase electron transfer subunit n=1 Tax=Paenibacillus lentus TaxID=1338368 RepID=A0A3S8RXA8_9BACL|nr:dihydroorotate dehydrogenase electron transfer subunit [Paenibacillus lentus]AZK47420.1 dihydroorotate dehydrogenase electron transfer subunit [Paenibacillus lentus]